MIPIICRGLIEVDFPIAKVSEYCAREKANPSGHPAPAQQHLWWARRPLAASVRYNPGAGGRPISLGMRIEFNPAAAGFSGWYAFEIRAKADFEFEVEREECHITQKSNQHYFIRRNGSFEFSNQGIKPMLAPTALYLPLMAGTESFQRVGQLLSGIRVYSIAPSAVASLQEPDSGKALRPDSGNLASVIGSLTRRIHNKQKLNRINHIRDLLSTRR